MIIRKGVLFKLIVSVLFACCFYSCKSLMRTTDEISIDASYLRALNRQQSVAYFQALFDKAAESKKAVYFPKGKYNIYGSIKVKNGVTKIYGNSSEISIIGSFPVFDLVGVKSGEKTNVSKLEIHSLIIDANGYKDGNGVIPIRGQDISNCNFYDLIIKNMKLGHGILLLNSEKGGGCSFNKIESCKITGEDGNNKEDRRTVWYPISFSAELQKSKDFSIVDDFKNTGVASSAFKSSNNNIIKDNFLDGGNYGINIISEENTQIVGNEITNNVRNISLQWSSKNNVISNNLLNNTLSSSILLGFGCSENSILNNEISSRFWRAEAYIKIGLACSYNKVKGNVMRSLDPRGGEYFVYIHCDSNNNIVANNKMYGSCVKAYIGLESAWNSDDSDTLHFAKSKGGDFSGYAHENMKNNIIVDNYMFSKKNQKTEKIYLGEIEDARYGPLKLLNTKVERNFFNGKELSNFKTRVFLSK